jgi:hypothetical protein
LREVPVAYDLIGSEDRAVRAAAALRALSRRRAGAAISRICPCIHLQYLQTKQKKNNLMTKKSRSKDSKDFGNQKSPIF